MGSKQATSNCPFEFRTVLLSHDFRTTRQLTSQETTHCWYDLGTEHRVDLAFVGFDEQRPSETRSFLNSFQQAPISNNLQFSTNPVHSSAMADLMVGESLFGALRVSGLYPVLPPKKTFPVVKLGDVPSLRELASIFLSNNLHLVRAAPETMPVDVLQPLYNYCWQYRKINNANFGYFASRITSPMGMLSLPDSSFLTEKTIAAHLNPSQPSPLFTHLIEIDFSRTNLQFRKSIASISRLNQQTLRKVVFCNAYLSDEMILAALPYWTNVTTINLRHAREVSVKAMVRLLDETPGLTDLNIFALSVEHSNRGKSDLEAALARNTRLQRLTMTRCVSLDDYVKALPPGDTSRLKYVCTDSDHLPSYYEAHFPELEALGLWGVDGELLPFMVSSPVYGPMIEELFIASDWATEPDIQVCARLTALKTVQSFTPAKMQLMAKSLVNLRRLEFLGRVADPELVDIGLFTQIDTLNMRAYNNPNNYTAEGWLQLLPKLPNLTCLKAYPLPYDTASALSEFTPKLKNLCFDQEWLEEDAELALVAKHPDGIFVTLPELEQLKIGERTDKRLFHFNAPNLRRLTTGRPKDSHRVTDLIRSNSKHLSKCTRLEVDWSDLEFLSTTCRGLEEFEFRVHKDIQIPLSTSLESVLSVFNQLRTLDIGFSNSKIAKFSLVDTLPLLRELTMSGGTLKKLELSLKSLLKVNLSLSAMEELSLIAKSLRDLDLEIGQIRPGSFNLFVPKLRTVYMTLNNNITNSYSSKKKKKQTTEEAKQALEETERTRAKTVETIFQQMWKAMPKESLRQLNLYCQYVPQDKVQPSKFISFNCPKLESFLFNSCSLNHFDVGVHPQLKSLIVSQVKQAKSTPDKLYGQIGLKFPNLTYVSLRVQKCTSAGIGKLLSSLQHLGTCEIECPEDGLLPLALEIRHHSPPKLKELIVSGSVFLKDESIPAFIAEIAELWNTRRIRTRSAGVTLTTVQHITQVRRPNGSLPTVIFFQV